MPGMGTGYFPSESGMTGAGPSAAQPGRCHGAAFGYQGDLRRGEKFDLTDDSIAATVVAGATGAAADAVARHAHR